MNIVLEDVHDQPLVINQLSPGDFFGEMALLGGERRSAAAITSTPVEMYVLKSEDILLALRGDPELAIEIIRGIASKLRFATLYIQKAISWSQHIASGQYHSAMGAIEYERAGQPKETQVDSLIANFFHMIKQVKRREEKLQGQLTALRIEIDEVKKRTTWHRLRKLIIFTNYKTTPEFCGVSCRKSNPCSPQESLAFMLYLAIPPFKILILQGLIA